MFYSKRPFLGLKHFFFGENQKWKISSGFYYSSFKRIFITDTSNRFSKAEKFILSTKRNFYSHNRVVKIPSLDDIDSKTARRSSRGKLEITVGGEPYTLEKIKIGGGQTVGGRTLYEIKGLDKGMITTARRDSAVYCLWLDPDNSISSRKYNIPGNLKMHFNGPVKAFSPVVRDPRDKSINILSTLISLPVYTSTLLVKYTAYFLLELVSKVLVGIVTRIVLPSSFLIFSSCFLTVGLVGLPLMGPDKIRGYLRCYPNVLNISRKMFFVGTITYVKSAVLGLDCIGDRHSGTISGSLKVLDSEKKELKMKRTVSSLLDSLSIGLNAFLSVVRGSINVSCSSVRACASFLIGVLTLNVDYFHASLFLIKQPFLEMRDDFRTLFGDVVEPTHCVDQIISFDKDAFTAAIEERKNSTAPARTKKIPGISTLGLNLRSAGFTEVDIGLCGFVPPSCRTTNRNLQ
ncbi:hypothetical protein [Neorickettsia findlayensis]|uniref:Uncharacterized protein n=1 Tax=Neorickettsia findlayensis TaxID=2686014 RepID=A0A6P1GAB2_9RICK|nr:hypothetical protein [Neorickettsia findlayensis]QHD64871.1 hypothetical protein GP480_00010 [Neorickettsia findlayensis]